MFTGIIEETGIIRGLRPSPGGGILSIEAEKCAPGLKPGDSIAVNGVCLTVVGISGHQFTSDLSAETLRRSSFAQARVGNVVNLERPLAVGDRLGGHMVQGHVDGIGNLVSSVVIGEGSEMEFSLPTDLERYLVVKGSVAVDGISLTVAALKQSSFVVAVIPHTRRETNLRHLKKGDVVNLETDILAKYIERFFQVRQNTREPEPKLTVEMLRELGY